MYHACWMIGTFVFMLWASGGTAGQKVGAQYMTIYGTAGGAILGVMTSSVVPVYLGIFCAPIMLCIGVSTIASWFD